MINFAFLIKLADEPHYIYHSSGGKFGHCISPGNCRQHSLDRRPALPTAECDCCPARRACRAPAACRRGYRIQVFSDNNARTAEREAHSKAAAISESFPQWGTYITYDSPYWRLRVGDFQTYEDATDAVMELKNAFPAYRRELRVVRDRIRIVNRP